MGKTTEIPRVIIALAHRAGIEEKPIWIPARGFESTGGELVRRLLARAEGRAIAAESASEKMIRGGWGSMRAEAQKYGELFAREGLRKDSRPLSTSTVKTAMEEAVLEIGEWWKLGERERVSRVKQGGFELRDYARVRKEILSDKDPVTVGKGLPDHIVRVAVESVGASWWRHRCEGLRLDGNLLRDAIYLAFLRVTPGAPDINRPGWVIAGRHGLLAKEGGSLVEQIEEAAGKAIRALKSAA